MSNEVAWTILALWPLSGLVVSYMMRRRGHELFSWGVLGLVFGPLSLALALDHVKAERTESREVVLREGEPGEGPVSVLIGVDGSASADAAARTALDLLGERTGRVTVARVLDFETGSSFASPETLEERARVEAEFSDEVADVAGPGAEAMVLVGRPADALMGTAVDGKYDLVVVAARGRSASRALLGSTANRIVRECPVPVLVVGPSGLTPEGFARAERRAARAG